MSVEDSESRRFELHIRLSFSEADLGQTWPNIGPIIVFSGVSKSLELSVLIIMLIYRKLHLKKSDWVFLEFKLCMESSRFHWHRSHVF